MFTKFEKDSKRNLRSENLARNKLKMKNLQETAAAVFVSNNSRI